jgi:G protein-coupled receptor GPR1
MSNVFRSFWFALFPLVQYGVYGQISSGSAFCQVSGFFLALGIEGSGESRHSRFELLSGV